MDKQLWQCQKCGKMHSTQFEYKTEEIFVSLWGDRCETETPQLWCGDKLEDKYLYWNENLNENIY